MMCFADSAVSSVLRIHGRHYFQSPHHRSPRLLTPHYNFPSFRMPKCMYFQIGAVTRHRCVVNYTDIQPKTNIDEISLLWLFCGC